MAKKTRGRKQSARVPAGVSAAIKSGKEMADDVIAFRTEQTRKRATAVRRMARAPKPQRAPARPQIPSRTRALLGTPASAGVLVAEGDSWFDYPFYDVLQMLEDDYLYDVESVAHKGDTVEDMAHSGGQFEEFARRLEKLLRANKVPRAILLSGGGNDIAGDEFAILLNHEASSLPAVNDDIVRGLIDVRLRTAYARIISALTRIAQSYVGRPIPIVTHGYDYALPDGRGYLGGFWLLPGPWLEPGFRKKGHVDFSKNSAVVVKLIDQFNAMLKDVSATPGFEHVHYLNLRHTLRHDGTYKKDWGNELHPTEEGFRLVSKKFADLVAKL
ncbi:GDSL-type esterase/lipase family protein [Bradyrhizobium sp. USDA 4504]